MHYAEALEFLFSQLPMFQRVGPSAYKKDLTNTLDLLDFLGNPHHQFPSIHVGGTNGKGSVSHLLAAILQASGLKTGLYVSPHYKDFRERIKINGQYIPRQQVAAFVEKTHAALESIQPSFFEMTVGMAFEHFAREKVDIAVVEVGLGGRLDSTNVITPLVSVITNISFDHMNMLGDTLPKIAFEKAGIIKPFVPVVVGEFHPESFPVFEQKALEVQAPLVLADAHFRASEKNISNWESTIYDVFLNNEIYLQNLEVGWAGDFQMKNLCTVLQTLEVLRGLESFKKIQTKQVLTEEQFRHGAAELRRLTKFMGRWQVISENPTVLCDSAHNEAGVQLAFEKIGKIEHQKLHIVTGFVNDKDPVRVLRHYPKSARYYFAKANIPRGMPADELRAHAAQLQLFGKSYATVKSALRAARRAAQPKDLVVVIGSVFVVAEVL